MSLRGTSDKFGILAQSFHWITAILVLVAFLISPGGSESRVYAPSGAFDRELHESLGVAVFGIVALRAIWRLMDRTTEAPPMPVWMGLAAKLVHVLLYSMLFALPLSAISGAWLEGHGITIFGIGDIPSPFAGNHMVGALLAQIHPLLGDAIMWIAGLHAAAGLFHHFILRDSVLLSMLPCVKSLPTVTPQSESASQ